MTDDDSGHAAHIGRDVVLHVLPRDANRGAQHHGRMLRDLLDSDDQEHLIVTLFGQENEHVAADIPLGTLDSAHLTAVARLVRLLRLHRPVVTVAHGSEPLRYLAALPNRLCGALVYHRIGVGMPQLYRQPYRALHQALLRRTDAIVAISEDVAAEIRSLAPSAGDKVTVIPNGRDPNVYFPSDDSHPDDRPPVAIFVGTLTPEKRPELFLRACQENGEVQGLLVGDGPLRPGLEREAEGTNVTVLGPRSDVPGLLRSADVFCFTSLPFQEGMPGVLIEAAMTGLPIVSTDVAGARDVVIDGRSGLIVAHDQEAAFCEALGRLVGDAGRRRDMSAVAVDRGRRFTLEQCAESWELLIREVSKP